MISAIIVDDEKLQQEYLCDLLMLHVPEVEIVSICSSIEHAAEEIKKQQPELVFLDVVIPPHSGFDLLSFLKPVNFEVIFTTTYQEYALKAFKFSAVDYLLKPYSPEELVDAVKKVKARISTKNAVNTVNILIENLGSASAFQRIGLATVNGISYHLINSIIRFEAAGQCSLVYFEDKSHLIATKMLADFEKLLTDRHFFRVHKSNLINLTFVKEYLKFDDQIQLADGTMVDLSRRKRDEFLVAMQRIST
jgi:two-component system LytT family response regulator